MVRFTVPRGFSTGLVEVEVGGESAACTAFAFGNCKKSYGSQSSHDCNGNVSSKGSVFIAWIVDWEWDAEDGLQRT